MSQTTMQAEQDALAADGGTDLVVSQPISATPARVGDQRGGTTPMYLSNALVGVGGTDNLFTGTVLHVQGSNPSLPLLAIYNSNPESGQAPEAAIRFSNASDKGAWWHMGVGGGVGAMKFFLFSSDVGQALALDRAGNLSVRGSITGGSFVIDGATSKLDKLRPVSEAPKGASLASVVVDTATGELFAV
jgi:hypothetical protein